ncbi:uncharacterized protein LOC118588808 [Onychomys torridus]|uniref:uncharacterized protein LOC118588808 n=1 Tax=Onychomys torridus TaxID=38674 RepID=UPI00167F5FC2|nr:uncharacterized protein LOC118588808 [Onychomys torridus]
MDERWGKTTFSGLEAAKTGVYYEKGGKPGALTNSGTPTLCSVLPHLHSAWTAANSGPKTRLRTCYFLALAQPETRKWLVPSDPRGTMPIGSGPASAPPPGACCANLSCLSRTLVRKEWWSHAMQLPKDATGHSPLALVSIILPVHNAEQWLDECLASVLQQDFEGTMELSVFNDASKDKSRIIIEKWKGKLEDSGISVVIGGHDSPSPRGGRRGSVTKKPYNPILGEIFQCHWTLPNDTEENMELVSDEDQRTTFRTWFLPCTPMYAGQQASG